MRILAYREILVKASGARVKAQIWKMKDGKLMVWLDNNWYPMDAFTVI